MKVNKPKVAILNYNIGNLSSIKNALLSLDISADIIYNAEDVNKFDRLILPGVGAFGSAIEHLNKSGMSEAIIEATKNGKYILGICLGMQLLFDKSFEFGIHKGLGLISGEVIRFDNNLKIPHIGWNAIEIIQSSPILEGLNSGDFLYFVHSFYVKPNIRDNILAVCDYGDEFSAMVCKDNIFGIQPHPEKSSKLGLMILKNFVELR
ncbi:imidazole glycerol phosphate synthase subunit HisH [Helicobacter sp. MIT 14-3879]|uniref:imidazole glycerol phosphate synthase subunit HisH n=1 Tax=Helicobacter sp. MIT 14-3879 TaxID=2040649 RepID=UPI000E1F79AF|nr:imidazole glycerol phosphate synthase subunit HisH [Helicobacter sp. MIT 14-3879]RDU62859.1 imidazole glycerol phosphate synthase subunit HisH [Helicobacter sp. MIT 14-3879]